MIAGVWFTFDRDAGCLIESVASFRKAGGGPVCIFDEEQNPLPQEVIEAIKPDLRSFTGPRGRNLNGWPAVTMILECCAAVEEAFPEIEGTLKLDSDTKTRDIDWIDPKLAMVGWDLGLFRHAYGCARYLRRGVPASCLDHIRSRYTFGHVAEDQAISCEVLYAFQGQVLLLPGRPSTRLGPRCGAWQYGLDEHLIAPVEDYSVVTYGNRYQMDGGLTDEEKRRIVAETMRNNQ